MFKPLLCMLGWHDNRVMWYEFNKIKHLRVTYECKCCGKLSTNHR